MAKSATLQFGFFNYYYDQFEGKYTYNTEQVSAFFSGIIDDGVFLSILIPNTNPKTKDRKYYTRCNYHFQVSPIINTMQVEVAPGKAWFNDTWNFLDNKITLNIDPHEANKIRYDAIVLEVDKKNKENCIKVIKGTVLQNNVYIPSLIYGSNSVWQHPLAYIRIDENTSSMRKSNIINATGFTEIQHVGPENLTFRGSQQVLAPAQSLFKDDFLNGWRNQINNLETQKENEFKTWWNELKTFFTGTSAESILNKLDAFITEVENSTGIISLTVTTNELLIGKTLIAHNNTKEYKDVEATVNQKTSDKTKGEAVFHLRHIGNYTIHDGHNSKTNIDIPYFGEFWTTLSGQGCCLYGFRVKKDSSDPSTAVEYLSNYINNTNYICKNANYNPVKFTETSTGSGDYDFDRGGFSDTPFFMPTLVMLNEDGSVAYKLDQKDISKTEDGIPSDIDDYSKNLEAMAAFPLAYSYRFEKDGYFYCYICDEKLDNNFTCWPFYNSKNEIIPYFYHAMALSTSTTEDGMTPRSLYGFSYGRSYINDDGKVQLEAAEAKYPDAKIWSIESNSDITYITDLLVLLTKNINIGSVLGCGCYGAEDIVMGSTNKALTTKDSLFKVKGVLTAYDHYPNVIFGIESFFGYSFRHILGRYQINGRLQVKNTYGTIDGSTKEGFDYDNKDIVEGDWIDTGVALPEGPIDKEGIKVDNTKMAFLDYNNVTIDKIPSADVIGFSDTVDDEWFYVYTKDTNAEKSVPIIKYNYKNDYYIELPISLPTNDDYIISADGFYLLAPDKTLYKFNTGVVDENSTIVLATEYQPIMEKFEKIEVTIETDYDNIGGIFEIDIENSIMGITYHYLYILPKDYTKTGVTIERINLTNKTSEKISFTGVRFSTPTKYLTVINKKAKHVVFLYDDYETNGAFDFDLNTNTMYLLNTSIESERYSSIALAPAYSNEYATAFVLFASSTSTFYCYISTYNSTGAHDHLLKTNSTRLEEWKLNGNPKIIMEKKLITNMTGTDYIYNFHINNVFYIKKNTFQGNLYGKLLGTKYDIALNSSGVHKEAYVRPGWQYIFMFEKGEGLRRHRVNDNCTDYFGSTIVAPSDIGTDDVIPLRIYNKNKDHEFYNQDSLILMPRNKGGYVYGIAMNYLDVSLPTTATYRFKEIYGTATNCNYKFGFDYIKDEGTSQATRVTYLVTDDINDILYNNINYITNIPTQDFFSLKISVSEQPVYGFAYNKKIYLLSNNYIYNTTDGTSKRLAIAFTPTIVGGIVNNKVYGIDSDNVYIYDMETQNVTVQNAKIPSCNFVTAAVQNNEIWFFPKESSNAWILSPTKIDFYNQLPSLNNINSVGFNDKYNCSMHACYTDSNKKYIFIISISGEMSIFDITKNDIYKIGNILDIAPVILFVDKEYRYFCCGSNNNTFRVNIIISGSTEQDNCFRMDVSLKDPTKEINSSTEYVFESGWTTIGSDNISKCVYLGDIYNSKYIFRYDLYEDSTNANKLVQFDLTQSGLDILPTFTSLEISVKGMDNLVSIPTTEVIYLSTINWYIDDDSATQYSTCIFKYNMNTLVDNGQILIDETAPDPSVDTSRSYRYTDCKMSLLKGQYLASALDPSDDEQTNIYYFPCNAGEYIYTLKDDALTNTNITLPIQGICYALSDTANNCIYLFSKYSGDKIYRFLLDDVKSTKFEFRYITSERYSDKGGWLPCEVDNTKGSSSTYYCSVLGNHNAETITGLSCIGNTNVNVVDGEEVPLSYGGFNALINPGRQFKAGSMLVCRPLLETFNKEE